MDTWQDPDLYRSASHKNAFEHLAGPLSAGAAESTLAIGADGRIRVEWGAREPVLLLALASSLDASTLVVNGDLDPDGANMALPPLTFSGYTESGASLVLYAPKADPNTHRASPFTVALAVDRVQPDGTKTAVPMATLASLFNASMVEGIFGRMTCVLLQEKQRLRRQAREIAACRLVPLAHDDALDRMGAELGLVRFNENLVYDNGTHQITTTVRREPDDEYRRRIRLFRRWMIPNRPYLLNLLNGPGADSAANAGIMAGLGLTDRFQIVEKDNPFAVSVTIVEKGGAGTRAKFLNYLRAVHLFWPTPSAAANAAHDARYLPQRIKDRVNQQRDRLSKAFQFGPDMAVAPMLAAALDRIGRCRVELGDASLWAVQRAQDSAAGSRYELGLGVDMQPLTSAILDSMSTKLKDEGRKAAKDPEVEALLRSMTPAAAAADPEGRWLLEACGMRTIHRTGTGSIYLSHLPTFGLMITTGAWGTDGLPLQALYQAPGDPGSHAVLVQGVASALQQWKASGEADWIAVADAAARTQWDAAVDRPAADHALSVFRVADLPGVQKPKLVVDQLKLIAPELLVTFRLPAALEQKVLTGDSAQAATALSKLAGMLRASGVNSVLPLVSGPIAGPNQVLLVAGVIGLPGAGLNLSERRSTGFRWYTVPLVGNGGDIRGSGSRSLFHPSADGVTAVVALGYARQPDKTDPYEYRVEMKDKVNLNLLQYEFLMNLLDFTCPAGVEVNTYAIRQQHVDLDGDKIANPLTPGLFRTYRQFQSRRQRGHLGIPLTENSK